MSGSSAPQLSPSSVYYGTTTNEVEVSVVVTPSYGSPNNSIFVQVYLWKGAVGQGSMVSEANVPYILDLKDDPTPSKTGWQTQTIQGEGVKAEISYMVDKKYKLINMWIKMHGPSATYFIANPLGSTDMSNLKDGYQSSTDFYAGPGSNPQLNGLSGGFNFSYNDGSFSGLAAVGPYSPNINFKDSTAINVGSDGYSLNGTLTAKGNVILFSGEMIQAGVAQIGFGNAVVGVLTSF